MESMSGVVLRISKFYLQNVIFLLFVTERLADLTLVMEGNGADEAPINRKPGNLGEYWSLR
jgi:hypothetical protein